MLHIAPSLLSADFGNLEREVRSIEESGADYIHLDVMDGHFVPNITFGPMIVDVCRKLTDLPIDVHLMITEPEKFIPEFAKSGADIITIHAESTLHLHRQVLYIKSLGKKAGVALNPTTSISCLEYLIQDLDLVLLMSVSPGFSGQKFIYSILDKIKEFNRRFGNKLSEDFLLQVDGGVNEKTVSLLKENNVNMIVTGSYFFKAPDRAEAVKKLKNL